MSSFSIELHMYTRQNTIHRTNYDGVSAMPYHITINTFRRMHFFGTICDSKMYGSDFGFIADAYIEEIPLHFPFIHIDTKMVMPNHCHILLINNGIPANSTTTIGSIIGAYKSSVSRIIHRSVTTHQIKSGKEGAIFVRLNRFKLYRTLERTFSITQKTGVNSFMLIFKGEVHLARRPTSQGRGTPSGVFLRRARCVSPLSVHRPDTQGRGTPSGAFLRRARRVLFLSVRRPETKGQVPRFAGHDHLARRPNLVYSCDG